MWLDGRYEEQAGFDANAPATWKPSMQALKDAGVRTLAPPMPVLLTLDGGRIVSSAYARAAREAGLRLVTWTLERSGSLEGRRLLLRSIRPAIRNDGDTYRVLDVLARDVGIAAIFSDWPATACSTPTAWALRQDLGVPPGGSEFIRIYGQLSG